LQRGFLLLYPAAPENKSALLQNLGHHPFQQSKGYPMDTIKSAFGFVVGAHDRAVAWVAAHPAATVYSILAAVAARVAFAIYF
jgi:hypothetical protein